MENLKKLKNLKRRKSSFNEAVKNVDYVPLKGNRDFHVHIHEAKQLPHMHGVDCDRLMSAIDIQRDKRYYFTCDKTPVRVYIKYEEEQEKRVKKGHSLSKKFSKEASNLIFIQETLSFIPNYK